MLLPRNYYIIVFGILSQYLAGDNIMKKKTAAAVALASCITLTATLAGCSLISKDNRLDMEQVIATVDISKSDKLPENLSAYKAAISSTEIVKRELVSYFLNVGYSYIQNGTSYKDTFNMLMDALIDNAVLTQYCTLELLAEDTSVTLEEFNAKKNDVEKYVYLLGGEESNEVQLAKYSLFSSLNTAIDNYEKTIIEEDDKYEGSDTRTTPTNLDTEQDDYYPRREDDKTLNYNVYTGYENYLLKDSGTYQDDAIEGTTRATRTKAYNSFINNLRQNYLIEDGENLTDIWSLQYIQNEYVNQLESRVINKYYKIYEEEQEENLKNGEEGYKYVQSVYDELLNSQKDSYVTSSAFETAMGSMSSSSFVLYSPSTTDSDKFDGTKNGEFGFVYNILLPFNAKQSVQLAQLNSVLTANDDKNAYYIGRNELLKDIKTTDQRAAWFNGSTKYAFDAKDEDGKYDGDYYKSGERNYLFFENNLTDSGEGGRYKKLQAYDGRYAYNGKAYENKDGSYTLIPEKLTIDSMLEEFSAYINYVLDTTNSVSYSTDSNYYDTSDFFKDGDDEEIDYSKFVYASGKVDFGSDFNKNDLMNAATNQYKAMSAVNELQFAYTTDTGVLSNYVGYSVSAYDTTYIKEFEYAAKKAVSEGEGAFTVCAGDYGWHLIYVTYKYDLNGGAVNGETIDWSRISTEGTFENLFFEWIKSNDLSNVTSMRRSKIISEFNKEATVVKYQKRYQDLLDLGD